MVVKRDFHNFVIYFNRVALISPALVPIVDQIVITQLRPNYT